MHIIYVDDEQLTYKRLADALEEKGIGYIIGSRENRRFLRVNQVDCDLYRLSGKDPENKNG